MKPKEHTINKEWHLVHRMPKNPTSEQRIQWHIAHAKHCSCRAIPVKLQEEIKKYQATHNK